MFKSIDLNAAVEKQYGTSATLGLKGNHLWDWFAYRGSKQYDINLKTACIEQYGSGNIPVSVGVHAYNWKSLKFNDLKNVFIPVLIVAPEYFHDITKVRSAIFNFKKVLDFAQNWYKEKLGSTFQYIQPIVIYSTSNVDQWVKYSELSRTSSASQSDDRRAFIENSYKNVQSNLPIVEGVNYISTVYVGERPDLNQGMTTYVFDKNAFVALTPDVTTGSFGSRMLSGVIHEIGHSLRLIEHSKNHNSIMYNAQIPNAILTASEIEHLKNSLLIN